MYTPIPAIRRSRIEPGDDITIDVYLSGSGNINANKLIIVPSSDELADVDIEVEDIDWSEEYSLAAAEDDENTTEQNISSDEMVGIKGNAGEVACLYYSPVVVENDQGVEEVVGFIGKIYKRDYIGKSLTISLSPDIFNPTGNIPDPSKMQSVFAESLYYGASDVDDLPDNTRIDDSNPNAEENLVAPEGHPPVKLSFPTSENVSPGDYQIHFVFTYNDGIIKQSGRSANIHIETWTERNSKLLRLGALVLSFIIAFSAIISIYQFSSLALVLLVIITLLAIITSYGI